MEAGERSNQARFSVFVEARAGEKRVPHRSFRPVRNDKGFLGGLLLPSQRDSVPFSLLPRTYVLG
jgi:hypothetical protein